VCVCVCLLRCVAAACRPMMVKQMIGMSATQLRLRWRLISTCQLLMATRGTYDLAHSVVL
jgi:hypothetical protein